MAQSSCHLAQHFMNDPSFRPPQRSLPIITLVCFDVPPAMIIDGLKFSCETCIRGHRAAGCEHFDRPLQQISIEGRPVSQCNHCRSLRQSRSVHTKCICAIAARKETHDTPGTKRCRCCEGDTCICASASSQSDTKLLPQAAPSVDGMMNQITGWQEPDQAGFVQPLPDHVASSQRYQQSQQFQQVPQIQQYQPQRASDTEYMGASENISGLSG